MAATSLHRPRAAGALLAGTGASVAVVAGALLVQRVAIPLSILWLGAGGWAPAAGALFGAAALSFVRARASDRLGRAVRKNLLELYLRPFERGPTPSLPSPEILTARLATALPTLVSWAVEGVAVALGAVLAVPAVAALLAYTLGFAVLIPVGVAGATGALVTLAASRRVERAWTTSWERSRALFTGASAGWAGAIDLRAHGRARPYADGLRAQASAWADAEGRARLVSAVSTWGAVGATLAAAIATTALLGARLAPHGDVYRSFLLVLAAVPTLQSLAGASAQILSSRGELANVALQRAIADAALEDEADTPLDAAAELRLEGIGYTYPAAPGEDGHVALRGAALVVAPRESVAIVGANGAGKTTLLHVLAGLLRPDRGRILVGGVEARLDNRCYRRRLAFLAQRPFALADGTIAENLRAFDAALPDARLLEVLETVGLSAALRARAPSAAATLDLPYAALSSGQARRVLLARALLRDADLLLLDEPEAHLDAAGVDELGAILRRIARDRRVVAVVHDRGLATFADRVVELSAP